MPRSKYRTPRKAGRFNLLTATYLLNHLAVVIYSLCFMFGFGLVLAQVAYFTDLVTRDNWIWFVVGVAAYIIIALIIALALRFTKYAGQFELRGNFIRVAGMLIVFVNRTYYLNFPNTPLHLAEGLLLIGLFFLFLVIHCIIKQFYYNICLGKNPENIHLADIRQLPNQEERNRAIVEAHRKTIHPRYTDLLDVYNVIYRKNGETGVDEYAIFYGMELNFLGLDRIVPLFKTIISLEEEPSEPQPLSD